MQYYVTNIHYLNQSFLPLVTEVNKVSYQHKKKQKKKATKKKQC